jgi:hypothetical protein
VSVVPEAELCPVDDEMPRDFGRSRRVEVDHFVFVLPEDGEEALVDAGEEAADDRGAVEVGVIGEQELAVEVEMARTVYGNDFVEVDLGAERIEEAENILKRRQEIGPLARRV